MTVNIYLKPFHLIFLIFFFQPFFFTKMTVAQKMYQEGKIVYKIESRNGAKVQATESWLNSTSYIFTIKGTLTRTETKTVSGSTITIFDGKLKTGALLNEYGNQKLLVKMSEEDIKDRDRNYQGMQVEFKDEKKTIAGYECNLALVQLKNGTTFRVFYAPALQFQNKHYDSPFHELPGFPLEFETEMGKTIYKYVAQEVDFSSVPSALFDIPKTGYKEMSYQEAKEMQGN
jgi:GLPGLI family protein